MRLMPRMMGWHSNLDARMICHSGFRNCSISDIGRQLSITIKSAQQNRLILLRQTRAHPRRVKARWMSSAFPVAHDRAAGAGHRCRARGTSAGGGGCHGPCRRAASSAGGGGGPACPGARRGRRPARPRAKALAGHRAVVPVGPAQDGAERGSAPVRDEVPLRAGLAAVRGVRPRRRPRPLCRAPACTLPCAAGAPRPWLPASPPLRSHAA